MRERGRVGHSERGGKLGETDGGSAVQCYLKHIDGGRTS